MGDLEGTLKIESVDISMKTTLVLTGVVNTFGTLRIDGKLFFNTLFGFNPYWDYNPTNAFHADNSGVYNSAKN